MWRVSAYTGKNRNIDLGDTFVRADSESHAKELGRKALRLTGVRGSFQVSVRPYYPWLDRDLLGFVREIADA
jgi:hypothetical protein